MSLFDKMAAAANDRLVKGGWACCKRHDLKAKGCCSRKIHTRASKTFCYGCGTFYDLSKNLTATNTQSINCQRHTSTRVCVPDQSGASVMIWPCCHAMGLEASVNSNRFDLKNGYTWGCESGRHYGVPIEIEIEIDDDNNVGGGGHQDGVKKFKINRPSGWYALELVSHPKPGHVLTYNMLLSSILGRKVQEDEESKESKGLKEKIEEKCLWERLQSIVLIKDVKPNATKAFLHAACCRAVTELMDKKNQNQKTTTTTTTVLKKLEILNIHRVYGKPFEKDSSDEEPEEEENETKNQDGEDDIELVLPYPMDGNRWQIECASEIDATNLKEALWKGTPGKLVKNAAHMVLLYIEADQHRKNIHQQDDSEGEGDVENEKGSHSDNSDNSDYSDREENESKTVPTTTTDNKNNVQLKWIEETLVPLQPTTTNTPNYYPLLIEPETTTCYDMGAQVSMLNDTSKEDWWRMHPPILIGAPRPLGAFYPISGACCYCGGPWQAKDGRKCRYHPSSEYFQDLILFKPYEIKSNKIGFDSVKRDGESKNLKCKYCKMSIFKSQLELNAHLKLCDMKEIPCRNDGCERLITKKHTRKHVEEECLFRLR